MKVECEFLTMFACCGLMTSTQSLQLSKRCCVDYHFLSWGNIRRLPIGEEMNRSGGAGVYYHVCVYAF